MLRVESVSSIDLLPISSGCSDVVNNMYPFDDEDIILVLYFSPHICRHSTWSHRYLARFQRAPEGPRQSATCRGDNIVKGRSMRFGNSR